MHVFMVRLNWKRCAHHFQWNHMVFMIIGTPTHSQTNEKKTLILSCVYFLAHNRRSHRTHTKQTNGSFFCRNRHVLFKKNCFVLADKFREFIIFFFFLHVYLPKRTFFFGCFPNCEYTNIQIKRQENLYKNYTTRHEINIWDDDDDNIMLQ